MEQLQFVTPSMEWRAQAMEYRAEHLRAGETELHGAALLEQMDYESWLNMVTRNRSEATVHPGWVPSSTFFVVRPADGRLVGTVDIRHRLNDFLAAFGGHIGYGVRPSERKKGYATEILRLALAYARDRLQLERAMIACYAENEASWRTILANGGRLERTFVHTDGKVVRVYWVAL